MQEEKYALPYQRSFQTRSWRRWMHILGQSQDSSFRIPEPHQKRAGSVGPYWYNQKQCSGRSRGSSSQWLAHRHPSQRKTDSVEPYWCIRRRCSEHYRGSSSQCLGHHHQRMRYILMPYYQSRRQYPGRSARKPCPGPEHYQR